MKVSDAPLEVWSQRCLRLRDVVASLRDGPRCSGPAYDPKDCKKITKDV